jgi:hypothetical protein
MRLRYLAEFVEAIFCCVALDKAAPTKLIASKRVFSNGLQMLMLTRTSRSIDVGNVARHQANVKRYLLLI